MSHDHEPHVLNEAGIVSLSAIAVGVFVLGSIRFMERSGIGKKLTTNFERWRTRSERHLISNRLLSQVFPDNINPR